MEEWRKSQESMRERAGRQSMGERVREREHGRQSMGDGRESRERAGRENREAMVKLDHGQVYDRGG